MASTTKLERIRNAAKEGSITKSHHHEIEVYLSNLIHAGNELAEAVKDYHYHIDDAVRIQNFLDLFFQE
jgi:hypothetical protein